MLVGQMIGASNPGQSTLMDRDFPSSYSSRSFLEPNSIVSPPPLPLQWSQNGYHCILPGVRRALWEREKPYPYPRKASTVCGNCSDPLLIQDSWHRIAG